jgi:hypothetical protein
MGFQYLLIGLSRRRILPLTETKALLNVRGRGVAGKGRKAYGFLRGARWAFFVGGCSDG